MTVARVTDAGGIRISACTYWLVINQLDLLRARSWQGRAKPGRGWTLIGSFVFGDVRDGRETAIGYREFKPNKWNSVNTDLTDMFLIKNVYMAATLVMTSRYFLIRPFVF